MFISYHGRKTEWDDSSGRWTVHTDRGDAMRARYVILANGLLTTLSSPGLMVCSRLPASPSTPRWNYHVDLKDKRVGIIGTGATAVQVVPEIAKVVKSLHVFQRTPSSVDVRDQRETTDEERDVWANEPGWARARRARFAKSRLAARPCRRMMIIWRARRRI